MTDLPSLLLSLAAGAVLAGVYLVILWISLYRLQHRRRPGQWVALGLIVRLAVVVSGFYVILGNGRWQLLLAALAGFVMVRTLAVGSMRRRLSTQRD